MEISKEKVLEIAKKYSLIIMDADDAEKAFQFVWEIICAEVDELKVKCPYATNAIERMEIAEHTVYELMSDTANALYDGGF